MRGTTRVSFGYDVMALVTGFAGTDVNFKSIREVRPGSQARLFAGPDVGRNS